MINFKLFLLNLILIFIFFTHREALIRSAFQCLQLVVADYPPVLPCTCLELCVDAAAKFASQTQELNVSLAAVGLLVSYICLFNLAIFFLI